jgi:curved DNA-binding protein CbpA
MRLGEHLRAMDLYGVLGVPQFATPEQIKQAHRRLARNSHPDLNQSDRVRAERRMVEINVAATVLLDLRRRAEYDRTWALYRCRARRPATRPAPAAASWYPWGEATIPANAEPPQWERPPRPPQGRRDRACEREVAAMVERLRQWPARLMQTVALRTGSWSPSQHALFTCASIGLAILLIAVARPSSLPMFQDAEQKSAQEHASFGAG